ncbi:hypothetical protein LOTGIDRAFT_158529 [Lottia gigantea]|uniref:G-protein coupled receptors family 1 profile domain-containing protein n=1 Tax=Lottia gigantea TaxID=225164 RepID=V4CC45_LOTGI|nr:hypothetical protein LOTGIDRAFT_158529 [Lottia gigantea]ESO99444.1 hypothetical protein LOTGIDRAFT_158529 [Lottia gigantea]
MVDVRLSKGLFLMVLHSIIVAALQNTNNNSASGISNCSSPESDVWCCKCITKKLNGLGNETNVIKGIEFFPVEDILDGLVLYPDYSDLKDADNNTILNQSNITNSNKTTVESQVGISHATYTRLNIVMGHIWFPLCAVGLVANIFNVVVFLDKKMRNATSIYLASISIFQSTFMIVTSIRRVPQLIYGEIEQRTTKFYYVNVIYLSSFGGTTLIRVVYCMVMLVAFERMLAILFPLKRARSRLVKSPVLSIVTLLFVSLGFHTFTTLNFRISTYQSETGEAIYALKRTEYDQVVLNNFSVASKVLFVYIPLTGIFIFNMILCVSLRRSSQSRKDLHEVNENKGRERQTTIAISVSTFMFLMLNIPMSTNSIFGKLLSGYGYFSPLRYTFLFVQEMGNILSLISYCVDFVTYTCMSNKYRETLTRKCCPCRYRQRLENRSLYGVPSVHSATHHSVV